MMLVQTLQAKASSSMNSKTPGSAMEHVRYALADNIYARAEIDCSMNIVNLWLGANVMLEYTYEEALEFLTSSISRAEQEYQHVKADLSFVRDQIVTSEVNISRIYNWNVRTRREEKKQVTTSTTN
jgi:hypothetical protein